MILHATGKTNIGNLALFWPASLPADFDERFEEEPDGSIEELRAEGKLILLSGEPNVEYGLGLFVDEQPAEELQKYCQLVEKIESLHVAGEGWFGGLELIFRDDRSFVEKHPRQIAALDVPPGTYFAEVYTTEVPDRVFEAWLVDQAGASAVKLWWIQTWVMAIGVVAFAIFVSCLFLATREAAQATFAVSIVLLLMAWLMSLPPGYRRVQKALRDYARAYPHYVICLKSS